MLPLAPLFAVDAMLPLSLRHYYAAAAAARCLALFRC